VFEVAQPFASDLLRDRLGPRSLARQSRRELTRLAGVVSELPYQVHDVMEELRDGQIEVGFVHKGLDEFMTKLSTALNRLVVALVVAGGLIGSSLIGIFAHTGPKLLGINAISVLGFFVSTVLGVWLLWGVIRSGRL
jgi:ubiquinone biosynthesis protein